MATTSSINRKYLVYLLQFVYLVSIICAQSQDACPKDYFFFEEVSENTPIDTVVLTLKLQGPKENVTFTTSENPYFRFDTTNLTIVVNRTIDYDVSSTGIEVVNIEITCKNKDGQEKKIEINIEILNVNDNQPVFGQDNYTISIGEMEDIGATIVTNIKATDKDANSIVYYSLPDGTYRDYFELQSRTATDLVLQKPLDFETLEEFDITIMALDDQGSVYNSTCHVTILVDDQDDQNPVFNDSVYHGVIASSDTLNSVIQISPQIYAHDMDTTINAPVVYSFHGQDEDILNISPSSGVVTLKSRPVSNQVYLLLQATQTDSPARYGVALLAVEVQGTNVHAPVFSRPSYAVVVTEVFPVSKVIAMVAATDDDATSSISYGLMDPSGTFNIDAISGDVTLVKQLSYAETEVFELEVTASDGSLSSSVNLTVRVYPINGVNSPPRVVNSPSDLNVTLTSRRTGNVVISLQVEDLDDTVLSYELLTYTEEFAVSSQGQITILNSRLLVLQSYPLTIVVRDASHQTPVVVKVTFPPPERVAAATMAESDSVVPVVLGVVAAIFFIIAILLLVYILRRRGQDKEHLDRVKRPNPSRDPKALTYKQKQATLGKKGGGRVNIDFRDQLSDGETTVQENPLSSAAKNTYFNFGRSDMEETDTDDIIQVETSVIPFDNHNDDNNNDDDNIYNTSDSESYRTMDKNVMASIYRNGSLSTFRDSESGSEMSLNTSPTDSGDSKRGLVGALARTRVPEERSWSSESGQNGDIRENLEPDKSALPQKQELTVYF